MDICNEIETRYRIRRYLGYIYRATRDLRLA